MNLTSCDSCGVVLDKDKLPFSDDIYMSDGSVDPTRGAWAGGDFVPYVFCPVCEKEILK